MIVGNGVRLTGNPNRFMAAPLAHAVVRSGWNKTGALRNTYSNPDTSKLDGIPSGMRHPQVWLLPKVAGALASRYIIGGDGALAVNLAGGLNADATLDGLGDIAAADIVLLGFLSTTLTGESGTVLAATALGQALADIAGTGELTSDITSVLNAVAALAGTGALDGDAVATLAAVADLAGAGAISLTLAGAIAAAAAITGSGTVAATVNAITQALVTLAGAGVITDATLDGLGLMLAEPAGTGDLDVTARADGSMDALIALATTGEELSPAAVAGAVKAALLDTTLDGYTLEDIIKLTSAALLGKSTGGGSAPVFRSLDDTADRVTGAVDASGNRTASVLTP